VLGFDNTPGRSMYEARNRCSAGGFAVQDEPIHTAHMGDRAGMAAQILVQ